MKPGMIIAALALALATIVAPAHARKAEPADPQVRMEAEQALSEALELWRDGNYEALYERTALNGRESKEGFARRLGAAGRRPACCWEKMQQVTVAAKGSDAVTVRATFGMEGPGNTELVTRTIRLVREAGTWKLNQTDLLALAGAKKNYRRNRRQRRKGTTSATT